VALGESVLSATNRPPSSRPSRSPSPSRSATVAPPPPEAVSRWKTKVIDNESYPDLYSAGEVVLAAYSNQTDVRALDPRTGKTLWSLPDPGG
jgi:outer membrane protein assembly factor BamB